MTCKNCGTEIADKALICYRCGQATFEAKRQPAQISGGSRRYGAVIVGLLLIMVAAGMLMGGVDKMESPLNEAPFVVAVLGLLIAAWGVVRRFLRRRQSR
jgi:hypothetical protein